MPNCNELELDAPNLQNLAPPIVDQMWSMTQIFPQILLVFKIQLSFISSHSAASIINQIWIWFLCPSHLFFFLIEVVQEHWFIILLIRNTSKQTKIIVLKLAKQTKQKLDTETLNSGKK